MTLPSSLIELLANKYILGSLGFFAALFYAYFKGRNAMRKMDEEERDRQIQALQSRVRAQEAKNAFIKAKGEEENAKIDHTGSIDELLGLWDSHGPGEGKDDPSDKKS